MFDDTNGYGAIPDALPAGYGYADAQPTTVRQNMETAVSTNPFAAGSRTQSMNEARPEVRPSLADAMPSGPIQARMVSASQSQARNTPMVRQQKPRPAYGNAAPSPTQVPIKVTKSGRRYREFRGSGGYIYAQFEDGSYAILMDGYDVATKKRGGYPKGVKQGVPFTAANNEKAFLSIRSEVEAAIGPFPTSGTAMATTASAGGSGGGSAFVASTADTSERPPPAEKASWFTQSTGGIPNWGWVAGAAVITASAGYLIYKNTQTGTASASPKPTTAPPAPAQKPEGQGA